MSRKFKSFAEPVLEGFNTTITGRNFEITDALRGHVLEKISKIEKYNIRIADASIIMDVQKLDQRCEIVLKLDHIIIKSSASSTDMYVSIDMAIQKIQVQIQKYRGKIREHQAKGVTEIEMNVNVYRSPSEEELEEDILEDVNGEIESANQSDLVKTYRPHQIVKHKTLPLKLLSYEEAIMKMELSEDPFLLFRSEEDQKLKVIYRRKDGNFGIIEAEA